jgi:hypothetical protein
MTREEPDTLRLLSRLESLELRALSWGHTSVSLTDSELREAAVEIADNEAAARELVRDLRRAGLLLDVSPPDAEDRQWRTRFAETMRLLATLRQWMRDRGSHAPLSWREAPELVNGFRVASRARAFPDFVHEGDDVIRLLERDAPLHPSERSAFEAMLGMGSSDPLKLASFQLEATRRIRSEIRRGRPSATIVCAGTGSGKTKAFYLPALALLARGRAELGDATPQALAIYPRNELLKDQLSTAIEQVATIFARDGVTVSVGAYFGPTPEDGDKARDGDDGRRQGAWRPMAGGLACPYIRCPRAGCGNDLVWPDEERSRRREILVCPRSGCGFHTSDGLVRLTRASIQSSTPDLLFTTTEMLNNGLSDGQIRHVFTGSAERGRPYLLLLDEVHTYSGPHGANAAVLLSRWRQQLGGLRAPLHVVGLSATLEEPTAFLSSLTNVDVEHVALVRPNDSELVREGADYSAILRGSPVSKTALLSTTIQSIMLLGRAMEARDAREKTGTSGWRLFAFTDTLDVLNRLYWDLQDAETNQLPALRDGDDAARLKAGQVWSRLTHALDRPLDVPLQVARTSSQDAGVDAAADVVVASASLEVGFDDPGVGAVIQHKAPRDVASFVQRKGRAGRTRMMRPWTLTVLSDYGRDRVAYQGYERLIEPVVPARSLPIDNLHVLKMQAAYAMLDWLSLRVGGLRARYHLSGPSDPKFKSVPGKQDGAARELRRVLTDDGVRQSLERHVRWSLGGLDDRTLAAVLWRQPRPLLTDAVPRLLRRLESKWQSQIPGKDERTRFGNPLPECLPDNLFSDLNLPEVLVRAGYPDSWGDRDPAEEGRPITSAIAECIPGNPTRRYAQKLKSYYHWLEPDVDDDGRLALDGAVKTWDDLGELMDGVKAIRLVRPWAIALEAVKEREARGRSARPVWASQVESTGDGHRIALPQGTPGSRAIVNLTFHTHSLHAPLTVARAAVAATVSSPDGTDSNYGFSLDGQPVSIGFREQADGIEVRFNTAAIPRAADLSEAALRAARGELLRRMYASSAVLRQRASSFQIDWLRELHVGALASLSLAADDPISLGEATAAMARLGTEESLVDALEGIFGVHDEDAAEQRGARAIKDLLGDSEVVQEVTRIADAVVDAPSDELDSVVSAGHLSTLAVALREAFQGLCPRTDAEGLVINIATARDGAETVAWLVEQEVGGAGTVEEILRTTSEDPTRLGQLIKSALGPSDLELVDVGIRGVLSAADDPSSGISDAFQGVRTARGAQGASSAIERLRTALAAEGIAPTHDMVSSLVHRILRPGSDRATDDLLRHSLDRWSKAEAALGLELDARAVAYAVSNEDPSRWRLEQVYSLLWPRGRAARISRLDGWSRFGAVDWVERLVVDPLFDERPPVFSAAADLADAIASLSSTGVVDLRADPTNPGALQRAVTVLLTTKIDVGSVLAHPRLRAAWSDGTEIRATIELPEALR